MAKPQIQVITRKMNQPFPEKYFLPHEKDFRFIEGDETIFLADGYKLNQINQKGIIPGLHYNFANTPEPTIPTRLHEKAKSNAKIKNRHENTAAYVQEYLRYVETDSALKLIHIRAGVVISTGQPYYQYGYLPGR